jgi:hypothetical protein
VAAPLRRRKRHRWTADQSRLAFLCKNPAFIRT